VSDDSTRQSVLVASLLAKPLLAQFHARHANPYGGAIPLKACYATLGLARRLAERLVATTCRQGRARVVCPNQLRHFSGSEINSAIGASTPAVQYPI
jgi:hypothetical protein